MASPVFAMTAVPSSRVTAENGVFPFPPIWLKMILVNLPSAVRRAALARTPVATLPVGLPRLTVVFVSAVARLFRAFDFDVFFLLVFMAVSLLWTGALPYACRERKLVLI